MKTLKYKDHEGSIEWSEADQLYHGKLLDIRDLIMYEALSLEELEEYFHEAVNDYIETDQKKAEKTG
ncbi:MAG: hypothetical protein IEMM0008_0297 [bacterium]|nr:MAG: hypothetical protein IEMM0008_0297 [bacterium]